MGASREAAKARVQNAKFGWKSTGNLSIEYLETLAGELDDWSKQVDAALQAARREERFSAPDPEGGIRPDKKTQSAGDFSDTPPWDNKWAGFD